MDPLKWLKPFFILFVIEGIFYIVFMCLQEARADAHQGPAQVRTPQNALQNTVPAMTTGDPEVDKKIKNLKKVWRDS